MVDLLQELNDENFQAGVVKSGTRVLVDFWAPWCAPCHGITRHLEGKAAAFEGKLTIVKVNADDAVETAAAYGVRGLPTLILLKDGAHAATQIGALSGGKLDALLKSWSEL